MCTSWERYHLILKNYMIVLIEFKINVNGFYISSEDLIKWQPGEGGLFTPVNISKTENFKQLTTLSGKHTGAAWRWLVSA